MALPVPLPDIQNAKLPKLYENAQSALAQCSRIDECQAWADKAEALASYAKQAGDSQLHKMADRIQARAIRRCGELLKQIRPERGGDRRSDQRASSVPLNRTTAANDAGLSERQKKTALRVAEVPSAQFEAEVESDNPPTVTRLAAAGTKPKPKPLVDLGGIPPKDYARATQVQGTLRMYAELCRDTDPLRMAAAFQRHEVKDIRKHVAIVDAWHDMFITNLKG